MPREGRQPATSPLPGGGPLLLPLEMRLATALPIHPLAMGCLIVGSLVTVHLAVQGLLGFPSVTGAPGAMRGAVLHALLIAYVMTIGRMNAAANARDVRALGWTGLPLASPVERERLAVPASLLRRSRRAAFVGAALGVAVPLVSILRLPQVRVEHLLHATFWLTEWAWVWAFLPILNGLVARGIYFQSRAIRDLRALARGYPVDLLQLRPLHVFGRIALRGALAWLVGISILLLFLLAGSEVEAGDLAVLGGGLAIGAASFLVPVFGIRRRLRTEKARELARLDEEIRVLRDRGRGGLRAPPGQLSDMVAYRMRIEAVSEWPFDAPTLGRFGLYLLIPLGSWLGGALVERMLERWLD